MLGGLPLASLLSPARWDASRCFWFGGVHAAVLSAEGGVLSIGSDTTINSCEGELSIVVDNGKLTVYDDESMVDSVILFISQ